MQGIGLVSGRLRFIIYLCAALVALLLGGGHQVALRRMS